MDVAATVSAKRLYIQRERERIDVFSLSRRIADDDDSAKNRHDTSRPGAIHVCMCVRRDIQAKTMKLNQSARRIFIPVATSR